MDTDNLTMLQSHLPRSFTTLIGTTKPRDGSVFLDPTVVDFKRWRQQRRGAIPRYSIYAK